jgi:hypothetical protein
VIIISTLTGEEEETPRTKVAFSRSLPGTSFHYLGVPSCGLFLGLLGKRFIFTSTWSQVSAAEPSVQGLRMPPGYPGHFLICLVEGDTKTLS